MRPYDSNFVSGELRVLCCAQRNLIEAPDERIFVSLKRLFGVSRACFGRHFILRCRVTFIYETVCTAKSTQLKIRDSQLTKLRSSGLTPI